jgi:hypothetical protein
LRMACQRAAVRPRVCRASKSREGIPVLFPASMGRLASSIGNQPLVHETLASLATLTISLGRAPGPRRCESVVGGLWRRGTAAPRHQCRSLNATPSPTGAVTRTVAHFDRHRARVAAFWLAFGQDEERDCVVQRLKPPRRQAGGQLQWPRPEHLPVRRDRDAHGHERARDPVLPREPEAQEIGWGRALRTAMGGATTEWTAGESLALVTEIQRKAKDRTPDKDSTPRLHGRRGKTRTCPWSRRCPARVARGRYRRSRRGHLGGPRSPRCRVERPG